MQIYILKISGKQQIFLRFGKNSFIGLFLIFSLSPLYLLRSFR